MKIMLNSGEEVDISVSFRKLAALRDTNKMAYEEYNRVIINGANDVFDYVAVIYAGYCCNALEGAMGYKKFIEDLPADINELVVAFNSIVAPKKKTDLPTGSESGQENLKTQ